MPDRANQLITDILRRIHEAIVENDITYEEYQTASSGSSTSARRANGAVRRRLHRARVEEHAFGNRDGSQGTILGPFHLPGAPLLEAPFELPHRPDEYGDRTPRIGRVTDADGNPLAGANLDIWQADAEARYASFMPGRPTATSAARSGLAATAHESTTVIPGPYTIPLDGPTGKMTAAADWSPWRPPNPPDRLSRRIRTAVPSCSSTPATTSTTMSRARSSPS